MGKRAGERRKGPKCIAIVGPFSSGKTTLLEALLARTGAIARQNTISSGNTVGDHSPEARAHLMSVEASFASTEFMGESSTFIDCPGSIEFSFEALPVLAACDLAIVVADPDEKKLPALQLIMRQIEQIGLPHVLFLNKIDKAMMGIRDMLKLLQPVSTTPLLLRQIPLRKDGSVVGSIDLALERAYIWHDHSESTVTEIPNDNKARELEARFSMLEALADHDDALMEQLLDEIEPARDAVFDDLTADLGAGRVTPVLIGSAENGNGIIRLLKTIRHDAPDVTATCDRLGIKQDRSTLQVMKTIQTPHGGKLSVARVLSGRVADGMEVFSPNGATGKISGLYRLLGKDQVRLASAGQGETIALGKLDAIVTGDTLSSADSVAALVVPDVPHPVYVLALRPRERKDDVKLSSALQKLVQEDPSLRVEQNQQTGETIISGHGEMHLRVTIGRLEGKYQIAVQAQPPRVPYRETIRKSVTQRGRHRKQSGGHGQFGDVVLDIKPLPRGAGFEFTDTITGGAVPKQYIPSVEAGVCDFLKEGPLGFPVIDIAVNLSDGSYHTVDSSDMAFQQAARIGMKEGMASCSPVLLEPIMKVQIFTPSEATARVTAIVPQRRGQILGFDAHPFWSGWDAVEATLPQAEISDLIVELRSATAGVASYVATFDHMAELTGRLADEVISANSKAA